MKTRHTARSHFEDSSCLKDIFLAQFSLRSCRNGSGCSVYISIINTVASGCWSGRALHSCGDYAASLVGQTEFTSPGDNHQELQQFSWEGLHPPWHHLFWWVLEGEKKVSKAAADTIFPLLENANCSSYKHQRKELLWPTSLWGVLEQTTGGFSSWLEWHNWASRLMALPPSPFCANWSHRANADEQIQWWDLIRLLWVNSRNAAHRPSASHTCGRVVRETVTRPRGWLPARRGGLQDIRQRRMV